ncbi:MAG: hypothetical protein HEQ10_23140 [Dolichospermum sp. DEX182a]|nr:hypothetical protein [Dolichospermum sp. DEX182a]
MTEKTDPCPCGGYKPTRREFFAVMALPQTVLLADTNFPGLPVFSKKTMVATLAVEIADELIKALDKDNEADLYELIKSFFDEDNETD